MGKETIIANRRKVYVFNVRTELKLEDWWGCGKRSGNSTSS